MHSVAGVLLNILLLVLIRRFTRKSLGTYKYLLTIFASFDTFLVILHAIVQPVRRRFDSKVKTKFKHVIIVKTTFGIGSNLENKVCYISRKYARKYRAFGEYRLIQHATSAYCAFFTVPFTLLCIHFLYRFWSVRHPHLIARFSDRRFIAILATILVAEGIAWLAFRPF